MIIRIKNLRLRTLIGINEWEKKVEQDVVINIEIMFDGTNAARTDKIDDAINYRTITKKIIKEVVESRFSLLESLAQHLVDIVMEDSRIRKATVEIDKPHALRYTDSVSVVTSAER